MIFVGVDWAEEHHDVCVLGAAGEVLAEKRIDELFNSGRELGQILEEVARAGVGDSPAGPPRSSAE